MRFLDKLNFKLKAAMLNKNRVALDSLRAIKSAIILLQTESGAKKTLSDAEITKLLQKLVKQRKESASIFMSQGRIDLAESEEAQIEVISQFYPSSFHMRKFRKL